MHCLDAPKWQRHIFSCHIDQSENPHPWWPSTLRTKSMREPRAFHIDHADQSDLMEPKSHEVVICLSPKIHQVAWWCYNAWFDHTLFWWLYTEHRFTCIVPFWRYTNIKFLWDLGNSLVIYSCLWAFPAEWCQALLTHVPDSFSKAQRLLLIDRPRL